MFIPLLYMHIFSAFSYGIPLLDGVVSGEARFTVLRFVVWVTFGEFDR